MRLLRLVAEIGGRGDREHLTDRLDPVRATMRVDEGHHDLGRRSSSACAKNDRGLPQDLIGTPEFADLTLQLLQPTTSPHFEYHFG